MSTDGRDRPVVQELWLARLARVLLRRRAFLLKKC